MSQITSGSFMLIGDSSSTHSLWFWFVYLPVIVLATFFLLRLLRRVLIRSLTRSLQRNLPHTHPLAFVLALHELVLSDPYTFMSQLMSEERIAFISKFWEEVGWKVSRAGQPVEAVKPALDVKRFQFHDTRRIAVVCFPPPERANEPLFIGVVLPLNDAMKQDLIRARRWLRYFVLNRFGGPDSSRDTDLIAYTADKQLRTYNIGAPTTPEGFAKAVEAKLLELKQ